MDYWRFNINLKEAIGLNCTKLFFKRPIYAMVSIVGNSPSKQRTSLGKYAGKNPTWGPRSAMRFYVEDSKLKQNNLVLMIQIFCKRIIGSDKVIGEVCVPLKELSDKSGGTNNISNYSYHKIVDSSGSGKGRGYLHFTYEFGDMIRGAVKSDDGATSYPLMRTQSHVIPSAPYLEYM